MKVYAFDVDDCLEIARGPVLLTSLLELRGRGAVVGLCGNLRAFTKAVEDWPKYISFTLNFDTFPVIGGPMGSCFGKDIWLKLFRETTYPGAEDYVMVGNRQGRVNSRGAVCGSNDEWHAHSAGWRFILEDDFAAGQR